MADIPSASSIDTMLEDTRFIAACVGAQETCEELIAQFQKELDQLSDIGAGIQNKKRVVVEIACAPDIYTAGSGTFMNEMLTMIGAENIFGDQEGYLAVTEEAVITLNPDVILTMVDYVEDPVAEILGRTGWEHVAAVVNGNVYLVNTNAVSLPNLHVIDGMKQMAKMIYPDAYAGSKIPLPRERRHETDGQNPICRRHNAAHFGGQHRRRFCESHPWAGGGDFNGQVVRQVWYH